LRTEAKKLVMMIDDASHYLVIPHNQSQTFKQKAFQQKSCYHFNVGRSMLPTQATLRCQLVIAIARLNSQSQDPGLRNL